MTAANRREGNKTFTEVRKEANKARRKNKGKHGRIKHSVNRCCRCKTRPALSGGQLCGKCESVIECQQPGCHNEVPIHGVDCRDCYENIRRFV